MVERSGIVAPLILVDATDIYFVSAAPAQTKGGN